MSWDDEDFDIPSTQAPAAASWDDDDVAENWDEEPATPAPKAAPKPAAKAAPKAASKAAPKKATVGKKLLNLDNVDEKTKRELLRQAELDSDLNNAADLFGGLGVAEDINAHPREKAAAAAAAAAAASQPAALTVDTPIDAHPLFEVEKKQDYERLRKALAPAITKLAKESAVHYSSSLAIDLIRDVAQPLSVEQIRKAVSTLNIVMKEKEKAERQARLAKAGGTSTGGAGKKKAKPAARPNVGGPSFKKDLDDMAYDDFGDDDFM